jgi:hypothetical protein
MCLIDTDCAADVVSLFLRELALFHENMRPSSGNTVGNYNPRYDIRRKT